MAVPPSSSVVGLFFLAGLFAVAIWNFVGIFRLWREHKAKALIPFVICLPFFFLGAPLHQIGLNHRFAAFQSDLPEFEEKAEAVVVELHARSKSRNQKDRSNHFGKHGDFNIYAKVDTNGVPTVRFVRVITMNFHHLGYMYPPDGKFDAAIREREWIQKPINDKWCAIRD